MPGHEGFGLAEGFGGPDVDEVSAHGDDADDAAAGEEAGKDLGFETGGAFGEGGDGMVTEAVSAGVDPAGTGAFSAKASRRADGSNSRAPKRRCRGFEGGDGGGIGGVEMPEGIEWGDEEGVSVGDEEGVADIRQREGVADGAAGAEGGVFEEEAGAGAGVEEAGDDGSEMAGGDDDVIGALSAPEVDLVLEEGASGNGDHGFGDSVVKAAEAGAEATGEDQN